MERSFISGDWGTSRLRLRWMRDAPLEVVAELEREVGIAATFAAWQEAGSPADRESYYLAVLGPLVSDFPDDVPLVLSGMASSSIGLRELPYADTPFPLTGATLPVIRIEGVLPREVVLLSGVRAEEDVMRGEETIVMGLELGEGLYVLPGTHSKHVEVHDGAIQGFRTYLTGELFALLREQSVLRTSLEVAEGPDEAFREAVQRARETELLHELFTPRARTLLKGTSPRENGQRLLGTLIGHELATLPPRERVVLAAEGPLRSYYRTALEALGHRVELAGDLALAIARGQRAILGQQ